MLFGFHKSVLTLATQILCIYFYVNMEYVCTCIGVHILAPCPRTPAACWPRGGADSPVTRKQAPTERRVLWQKAPCFWGADFTSWAPRRAWARIIKCSPNRKEKEETSKRKGRTGFVFQMGSWSLCVASPTASIPTNKSQGYLNSGGVFKIEGKIAMTDYIQYIACQKVWEVRIVGTGKDWGVSFKHAGRDWCSSLHIWALQRCHSH